MGAVNSIRSTLRTSLTPLLERASIEKDLATAAEIKVALNKSADMARDLKTQYTDPTALHVGFRREEHVGSDSFPSNDAHLRHAQGLPPVSIADTEEDITKKNMPQDLIEFMNVMPMLQKVPSARNVGVGRTVEAQNRIDSESRPLPGDK